MDIKTLLNPSLEDGGYGAVDDGGGSMVWSHRVKVEQQVYRCGVEEFGRRRDADGSLHRPAQDPTMLSQDLLHFRPSYHGDVIDRDEDESPCASTHKSSISRSSFSSFTSTCPSVSGTSSSLYPDIDRSFSSPPIPPRSRLHSLAALPAENRHLPSVDAARFTTTSPFMARSPPHVALRTSPPVTNFREPAYPLVSTSRSESSTPTCNRHYPSPATASPGSTVAALVSIATPDHRREFSHHEGLGRTQSRQECDGAHDPSMNSNLQGGAGSRRPQRQQSTDASNTVTPSPTHDLNAHYHLERANDMKDDRTLDHAEKSGSSTPRCVVVPDYGQEQQMNISQAESVSSGCSTPLSSSRARTKSRHRSAGITKTSRRQSKPRSESETERPALASLSPMPSSHSGGSPAVRPLDNAGTTAVSPGPKCSYTENCTTGSPLRKVVSHIFGRNKLCTRQIPKSVWVHYCRKHYQRSRYRNPRGFALLQCDLVRKQVHRLQIWGGVTDWVIKVRKREELRLSKEKAEKEAGLFAKGNDDLERKVTIDMDDQTPSKSRKRSSASSCEATKWLLDLTGSQKATADVLYVLERIEKDIADTGASFPDVEILPNVGQTTKARSARNASPRKIPRSGIGSQGVHALHSGIIYPDSSCGEASSDSEGENIPGNGPAEQNSETSQGTSKRKRKPSEDVSPQRNWQPAEEDHDEQRPMTKRRRIGNGL
ncbi:hypothetical protein GP486_007630 [Trichoglossum hirsutum]|uniref:ORP1 like protein n=1 Tax=Trichoglossum hirsutum TaxID=265104 RepID=A0A9P8L4R1_9PEZI|nr:hypothetical protein GP486_007630 [Trichoglossum hirsutum]